LSDFRRLRRHFRVATSKRTSRPATLGLPPQFWLRSSLFKGLGAKTCHKITPNALVPQGGRSRSESPRRGLRDEGWSYDSLSRFLLDLERSLANQRRESSLSLLSEKQYLISADRSRNCRFISPGARRGGRDPSRIGLGRRRPSATPLKNAELTAANVAGVLVRAPPLPRPAISRAGRRNEAGGVRMHQKCVHKRKVDGSVA
jgi:hypothetical protein